ncbi:MAG: hypothetical protein UC379_01905, partial [Acutalibacteraceae bacterium]|nr:hypothetical protein [Acutalibacteraceae bacterium]
IGCVCKCREALSLAVLIGRKLDHKSIGLALNAQIICNSLFSFQGAKEYFVLQSGHMSGFFYF